MDDLRLCIDWLIRCQILPKDHYFTQTIHFELSEFVSCLRDGVILCQLLHKLSPNSMDKKEIAYFPQSSQCLCIKNIKAFLHSCLKYFLLEESDIFKPADLYESSNIDKVIHTLSVLSHTEQALSHNIAPFSISKKKDAAYYNTFNVDLKRNIPCTIQNDVNYAFENDADVYGRLIDLFQPNQKDQSLKSKREMCIKELIVTENNYIDALIMIKSKFMSPLRDALSPLDFSIIFMNIDSLYEVHCGFHKDLKRAWSNDSHSNIIPNIPDCFVSWKERFLVYAQFCSNLPKAQNLIDSICSQNATIYRKVEQCQMAANEGRFKLRDLLSVPMQRVLKYHLFLKELIRHTDVNHIERKSLEKAFEEIQDLSLYVNEVKRDNEALLQLADITQSITDFELPEETSFKDYGRLIYDGELKIKAHSDNKTKNRYGFLFDKVLLLCKPKGEYFSYKSALLTVNYNIEDIAYKEKNFNASFLLGEKNRESAFTFGCKTQELKTQWMEAFKKAQLNVSPPFAHNLLHDFEMSSFKEPTICDVCRKLLRGVFYQGYRCKKTNMVVHKDCIEKASEMTGPPQLPPKPTATRVLSRQSERLGKLKVIKSYFGVPPPTNGRSSLHIQVGQILELMCDDDTQWLEGRYMNREGYFPKECVLNISSQLQSSGDECPLHCGSVSRSNFVDAPVPYALLNPMPWFAGSMSREEASRILEHLAEGAYLIRVSQSDTRRGEYALSIKYGMGQPVKHIKIQRSRDGMYFIADDKYFNSVIELVQYYQRNSLEQSFSEVATSLAIPYHQLIHMLEDITISNEPCIIGHCRAQYDYVAMEANQLSLTQGDRISVLSKAGSNKGWWKGILNGKTGFFPSAFVIDDDDFF